jgi:hypothetical protein
MAAPHVSAVAALLLNYLSNNDPANANSTEVRRRISDCADPVGALGQNMLSWSRYGRLNAAAALTCGGGSPTPPSPGGNHIGDLDAKATASTGNSWTSTLTVTIHGADESAVSGVTVDVVADYGTGSTVLSCITNGAGSCTTADLLLHKKNSSAAYTVQSLDIDYSPQDNHDADGDSDGTTAQVNKP